MKKLILIIILPALIMLACGRDDSPQPPTRQAKLDKLYNYGHFSFELDTLQQKRLYQYNPAAGNEFEVTDPATPLPNNLRIGDDHRTVLTKLNLEHIEAPNLVNVKMMEHETNYVTLEFTDNRLTRVIWHRGNYDPGI